MSQSAGREGASSQSRSDPVGSVQIYPAQSSTRRSQGVNANYLLNFHYDPISRPQPRTQPRVPPPRRQQKIKPYNKDLFLQANYKFVVLDTGNYEVESMDPDKMLQWEDIICVSRLWVVDDLEKLPYVCAALDQLEERMKSWMEHRLYSSSPPLMTQNLFWWEVGIDSSPCSLAGSPEQLKNSEKALLSNDEDKAVEVHLVDRKDAKERDSYTFYQVADGQHLILHPLNMKCLLHHYGGYDILPPRLGGKILELESVTQSEAMRRRYRFLSHFSLTTTFQLCEIDLSDVLPPSSLSPFMDEIKKREKQRKRLAKKEQDEREKAEAAAAKAEAAAMHAKAIRDPRDFSHKDAIFSLDDFEALGSSALPSTSPPSSGERKLFSDVTRLGFASAHDSPSLRVGSVGSSGTMKESMTEASNNHGPSAVTTLSFANAISSARAVERPEEAHRANGFGKRGKKPAARVLLSTSSSRRY
uniref:RING finger protein 10 n=1 Tax=Ananas comosus var. bracteatus TaxID=296719 RepID=A0A6V7Q0I0_ANACO|nr:unnamed protein product [Ananas comosus var. bracteatus]